MSPVPQTSPAPATAATAPRDGGVTLRVVVLCLGLAVLFGYVIPIVDFKLFNTFLGATHLPPGAIAALLVLLLIVNPLLGLVSKAWRFSRNETLTVYISCLFSCLIPGHGGESFVIPNLLAPFYYATRENKWLEWLEPAFKPWFTPALNAQGVNAPVVNDWFNGLAPGQPIPWGAWLVPLLFWGAFTLVSYAMLGCLSVILRKQWAQNEALSFPLLKLPLELTEGVDENNGLPPFFRNGIMWIGFGLAVAIQLLNGLNLYFPDVPPVILSLDMGPYLSDVPWNQIGGLKISVYPIAVGIAFLLTREISFSLWFFLWVFKFQLIAAYLLGYAPASLPDATGAFPGKMFQGFQMGGAYLAYVGLVLWMARRHISYVARRAFGRARADADEAGEVLSYPLAFWGFAGSFALMVGATVAAGVRFDIALALWIGYLVFAIGLTRVAVEGGLLFLLHMAYPLGALARLFNAGPSLWLTAESGAVPASVFQSSFIFHMRGFLMPSFVQSFKLAYDCKINGRRLGMLLAAVVVVTLLVSWPNVVRLGYENGGLQMGHKWFVQTGSLSSMKFATGVLKGDQTSVASNWAWLGVGIGTTLLLMLGRARFAWFPFHPIGYLMGLSFPISVFWFGAAGDSIFVGNDGVAKRCRVSWRQPFRRQRFGAPGDTDTALFLGLALGDVLPVKTWTPPLRKLKLVSPL